MRGQTLCSGNRHGVVTERKDDTCSRRRNSGRVQWEELHVLLRGERGGSKMLVLWLSQAISALSSDAGSLEAR